MVTSGKAARYSPGVKDFLTFGSRIAEVGENIIEGLRQRCPGGVAEIDPVNAKPGDTVRINEGPFSGLEAVFEQKLKAANASPFCWKSSAVKPGSSCRAAIAKI